MPPSPRPQIALEAYCLLFCESRLKHLILHVSIVQVSRETKKLCLNQKTAAMSGEEAQAISIQPGLPLPMTKTNDLLPGEQ